MNSWIFKLCVCVSLCVYTYKYMLGRLCSTLRDTMDCSSPGSSLHRDSPGNCSGLPCPLPWYLPNLGIETRSLTVQWILYHLSQWGSQRILEWVAYPFPTQELNWSLQHCWWILYQPSYKKALYIHTWSEVKWSHSVMSDSLQPNGL